MEESFLKIPKIKMPKIIFKSDALKKVKDSKTLGNLKKIKEKSKLTKDLNAKKVGKSISNHSDTSQKMKELREEELDEKELQEEYEGNIERKKETFDKIGLHGKENKNLESNSSEKIKRQIIKTTIIVILIVASIYLFVYLKNKGIFKI